MTAHLYVADQRGYVPIEGGQRLHTFNAPGYVATDRDPFGTLFLCSDDSLRAGAELVAEAGQDTALWLLPIVGGLEYRCGDTMAGFVEPGQVGQLVIPAGTSYAISNPYETETTNYLQLGFATQVRSGTSAFALSRFDLGQRNVLHPLLSNAALQIGCYAGRGEGTVPVGRAGGRYFVFVLSGAFEVANRLLHPRDGLALHYEHEAEIDFEALSNDAILLISRA
jgi:quercetin 2,3-dioxygenase